MTKIKRKGIVDYVDYGFESTSNLRSDRPCGVRNRRCFKNTKWRIVDDGARLLHKL